MSRGIRNFFFIVFALAIIFVAWRYFKDKDYKGNLPNLLKIDKLVSERDQILKEHRLYIKALEELRDKIRQIGARTLNKIEAAKTLQKSGNLLEQSKMWDLALKNYQIGLEIFPQDGVINQKVALINANLGLLYFEKVSEYWAKAEKHYLLAIKHNPKYSPSYYGLTLLYINYYEKKVNEKKLLLALKYINRYISLNSQDVKGYFARARIYYNLGQKGLAMESYRTILGLSKEETYEYKNALRNIKKIQRELDK